MIPLFKVAMDPNAAGRAASVLNSGFIGQGPVADEFEKEFAAYVPKGMQLVLTNSCTSAIHMVLTYLGVKPGDEIITTPMTCIATNAAIVAMGAIPIWADVNPVTGNIDPEDVERKRTRRTQAIIAVDWTGRPANYAALRMLGLPIIQDAAHGPILDRDGVYGDYICYSFGPIKHLCASDGGAVACPSWAAKGLRILRWYGLDRTSSADFRCAQNIQNAGMKWNINDISAAIGLANLRNLKKNVRAHQDNAADLYTSIHNNENITKPRFSPESNYWVFPILLNNYSARERFKTYMAEQGIAVSQVHARNDKHVAYFYPNGPLPGVDEFDWRQVNLPCGWWMTEADIREIARLVNVFV